MVPSCFSPAFVLGLAVFQLAVARQQAGSAHLIGSHAPSQPVPEELVQARIDWESSDGYDDCGMPSQISLLPYAVSADTREALVIICCAALLQLQESGEKERLKELLRKRLFECGWHDDLKAHCKEVIKSKGMEKIEVEDLVREITRQIGDGQESGGRVREAKSREHRRETR